MLFEIKEIFFCSTRYLSKICLIDTNKSSLHSKREKRNPKTASGDPIPNTCDITDLFNEYYIIIGIMQKKSERKKPFAPFFYLQIYLPSQ